MPDFPYTSQWARSCSPKMPLPWGIWAPPNTWFLGLNQVHTPNSTLIGSAIFARQVDVTNRTHTHTHTIGHILCCAEAMWPNNKNVTGYYYRAAFTMRRLKSPKTCHWKPPKWYIKIHFNHYIVFSPYCRNRRWWHLAGRHYGAWQTALWRPTPADDKGHTVALAHDSTPANDSSQMTAQWHLY